MDRGFAFGLGILAIYAALTVAGVGAAQGPQSAHASTPPVAFAVSADERAVSAE